MLQKIVNLIQENHLVEAQVLCEQLTHNNKKNPEIWLMLADIYQRLSAFDKAENSSRKAIKLKPDHISAHTNLAMLYHRQGKLDKAEPCYRQALKLDNNQASVHFNLGTLLQASDKLGDAITSYRQAIELKPDYAKAYANLGFILRHQKKTEEAIDCYKKAVQFAPDIAEIHYNLALSLLEVGNAESAEQYQQQALDLKPDYADALAGLGTIHYFKGDIEKALDSYQQALNLQPYNVEILQSYANILSAHNQHERALAYIQQALNIEPDNLKTLLIKGYIHLTLGELDEALDCSASSLKKDPQDKKAINLAASVYEKKGDFKQAYHHLTPLLDEEYPLPWAVLTFASISKSLDLIDDAIEQMERLLLNSKTLATPEKVKLHFALGEAYDNQKDYKRAFINFHTANKLKQAKFDIKSMQKDIDNQINIFSLHFSTRLKKSNIRTDRPIFIVGMPRSGTSLVEQILASHTQVAGAGELPDINNLANTSCQMSGLVSHYPECIEQIDSQQLDNMAQIYLNRLSTVDSNTRYVTDKMPGNYMHLGLIQLLFPDSRVIHCIRDPLDTCLSCYFQNFSQSHPWIYDLQHCGQVYLEYQRMMKHWKNVLDLPILDVHYEDLVKNQAAISQQMVEFCEIEWEDSCLQFHKNKRLIWTASYDQVRQPMYNKSVARWKNYESHIKPLIEILKSKRTSP